MQLPESFVCFVFVLALVLVSKEVVATSENQYPSPLPCIFVPGYTVGNRTRELECCKFVYNEHKYSWSDRGNLTSYLQTLRGWNCTQFADECVNRTYAFTPLYKRLYERFCNTTQLVVDCEASILKLPRIQTNVTSTNLSSWETLIANVDFQAIADVSDTCVQVGLYDSPAGGFRNYHEIIAASVPFCQLETCGYDAATLANGSFSQWTSLPIGCHANLIVTAVVVSIIGMTVIISNITVLYVLINSPKLRNSQSMYKGSLAISDLLVGLMVYPSFVATLFMVVMYTHKIENKFSLVEGYSIQELASGLTPNATTISARLSSTRYQDYLPLAYTRAIGFFSAVSLMVSLYSLMLASFDRLWAVGWPFHFKRSNPKLVAKTSVSVLWIVAITIGVLPLYDPQIKFGAVASVLILYKGEVALYLYTIALVLPLLIVWGTTLATYCVSKRHNKVRRNLTGRNDTKHIDEMETRLARTLALMVAVFSACLLPAALVLIIPFFLSNVYYTRPTSLDVGVTTIYTSFEFVGIVILMSNSLWNCFIYSLRNPDFKATAKRGYVLLWRKLSLRSVACKLENLERPMGHNRRISTATLDISQRGSMATTIEVLKDSPQSRRAVRSSLDLDAKRLSTPDANKLAVKRHSNDWRWNESNTSSEADQVEMNVCRKNNSEHSGTSS